MRDSLRGNTEKICNGDLRFRPLILAELGFRQLTTRRHAAGLFDEPASHPESDWGHTT